MAQAKARLPGGAERPRNRPVRPAAPAYAAMLRGAQTRARIARTGADVRDAEGRLLLELDPDPAALEAVLATGLYEHSVSSLGAHIASLACGEPEVGRLLGAYDAILPGLALRAAAGAFDHCEARRA